MATQKQSVVSSGDVVYDVDLQIAGIIDFGMTLEDVSGGANLPPAGVRINVAFEGSATGLVSGRVDGVDYLYIRSDGLFELHIHGSITTDDDARVSFSATGHAYINDDGTARLVEYITAMTAFEQYDWINQTAMQGEGTINLATGKISLQATAM